MAYSMIEVISNVELMQPGEVHWCNDCDDEHAGPKPKLLGKGYASWQDHLGVEMHTDEESTYTALIVPEGMQPVDIYKCENGRLITDEEWTTYGVVWKCTHCGCYYEVTDDDMESAGTFLHAVTCCSGMESDDVAEGTRSWAIMAQKNAPAITQNAEPVEMNVTEPISPSVFLETGSNVFLETGSNITYTLSPTGSLTVNYSKITVPVSQEEPKVISVDDATAEAFK